MDPIVFTTIVVTLVLFVALGSGIWIGLALCLPAYVGMEFFTNAPVGRVMVNSMWGWTSLWSLAAMPLFVWMGEILFRSRMSEDMFTGLAPWLARLPGGLLHVNIIGCAMFAAASGSSAVTAATVGRMSLPELKALGYPDKMSLGTLAGSGTLGFLIPPSILLIVYGATAELSISRLFIAGILPGVLIVFLFMGFVIIWSLLNRDKLPPPVERFSFKERIYRSRHLIPVISLIILVIGSIYTGIATPTEAAAVGVAGALAVSYFTGSLSRKTFFDSVSGATRTTCMIGLIVAGAGFLTIMMGYTKIPRHLAELISSMDLSVNMLIFVLTLFYILLGFFLEGISIIVLSAAIILPMVDRVGIDLIWFGIYLVLVVELALITPPVGFNLFIIQGLTGRNIFYVARVAFPFFCLLLVAVMVIVIFPEVVTWLPKLMM